MQRTDSPYSLEYVVYIISLWYESNPGARALSNLIEEDQKNVLLPKYQKYVSKLV